MSCKHTDEHGAIMEIDQELEHFLLCCGPDQRLEVWRQLRHQSDLGSQCLMMMHSERLDDLEQRLHVLLDGMP